MIVLIPVICWNTANAIPMVSAWRTLGLSRSRALERRWDRARTSMISASMSLASRTRSRTARASSSRPWATSQCGLSCWKYIPRNIRIAGIAARPNISRQFWEDASP